MGAPIAVPSRSQRAPRLPPHLPPFPRGGMGGDWPLRRVPVRRTGRSGKRGGSSGTVRGADLGAATSREAPPRALPLTSSPTPVSGACFAYRGGHAPPRTPPLASLTIPHLIAPLMARLLPASASARRSSLDPSLDALRPLLAPPRCLVAPPPPPSRVWRRCCSSLASWRFLDL